MAAPERNAPCPCGSGDKFKKCCGSIARRQQIEREDAAERERQHQETMRRVREQDYPASRAALASAIGCAATGGLR